MPPQSGSTENPVGRPMASRTAVRIHRVPSKGMWGDIALVLAVIFVPMLWPGNLQPAYAQRTDSQPTVSPPTVSPPTVPHKVTVDPKTLGPAPSPKTVPEGEPLPTEPPPKRTPVPDPVIQLREHTRPDDATGKHDY